MIFSLTFHTCNHSGSVQYQEMFNFYIHSPFLYVILEKADVLRTPKVGQSDIV